MQQTPKLQWKQLFCYVTFCPVSFIETLQLCKAAVKLIVCDHTDSDNKMTITIKKRQSAFYSPADCLSFDANLLSDPTNCQFFCCTITVWSDGSLRICSFRCIRSTLVDVSVWQWFRVSLLSWFENWSLPTKCGDESLQIACSPSNSLEFFFKPLSQRSAATWNLLWKLSTKPFQGCDLSTSGLVHLS